MRPPTPASRTSPPHTNAGTRRVCHRGTIAIQLTVVAVVFVLVTHTVTPVVDGPVVLTPVTAVPGPDVAAETITVGIDGNVFENVTAPDVGVFAAVGVIVITPESITDMSAVTRAYSFAASISSPSVHGLVTPPPPHT